MSGRLLVLGAVLPWRMELEMAHEPVKAYTPPQSPSERLEKMVQLVRETSPSLYKAPPPTVAKLPLKVQSMAEKAPRLKTAPPMRA